VDRKVCNICVILRLGEKLVVNMCFIDLYSLINPLSIANNKYTNINNILYITFYLEAKYVVVEI
jgi:hypothetical protein